jgi:hypothetical protein
MCLNFKKGRFAYLRWKIYNKISIRTRLLSNKVLLWLEKLWKDVLCWDEMRGDVGGKGGCFLLQRFFKEEWEIGKW